MKVAVIGAGCSGITAIKNLLSAGIRDVVCFEQNDRVGGNWIYSRESSHSSVMETTHIISSKKLSEYKDYPMPDDYPDYPSHQQILAYFEGYAEHFELKRYIRFNTKVDKVNRDEAGLWQIYTNGADIPETYDFLLVSNGHHSVPRHPELVRKFTGKYFHSHDFKTNEIFSGKRVLVIGGGNSACDCAVEGSRVADFVAISMRRPQYIVPKFMLGKPTDTFNDKMRGIPEWIAEPIRKLSLKLQMGKYEYYGLNTPDFPITKDHPTVNSELLYMLRHGKIKPKGGIEKVDQNRIYFTDGSSDEFDVIVAATGYKISTPFFDPEFLDYEEADDIKLYLRMFHPTYHNLIFIGLVQPQGAVWPLSEVQSILAAKYIKGNWQLPDNIHELTRLETEKISRDFLRNKRHTVEVHYAPYMESVNKQIKSSLKIMSDKQYILITGGSSGIGLATARIFASKGYHVMITSLDKSELDMAMEVIKSEHNEITVHGLTIDLSKDKSSSALYEWVKTITEKPNIVMNNAGFATYGFIGNINYERDLEMIDLMVKNLYLSTRFFLKDMLKNDHGSIINISSISAFQPNPTLATYGAIKAFVYQFSRAICQELKDKGSQVRCITICPTAVRSNFQKNSGMQESGLFNSWMTVDANFVAKEIYRAHTTGIDVMVPGRLFNFIAKIETLLPEKGRMWLAKYHLKRKSNKI